MADLSGASPGMRHSCVELRTPGGRTVDLSTHGSVIRPPRSADDIKQCDVMLVSHGHFDIGSAPRCRGAGQRTDASRARQSQRGSAFTMSLMARETQLDGAGVEIIGMNKGGTVDARGLKVTMVHADHSAGDWSAAGESPMYLGEPVGFVVELEDGMRILFAGDTDVFGDMKLLADLHRPDVAFLPIPRALSTMGPGRVLPARLPCGARPRGRAHPLRHVPDPRRDAGSAARRAPERGCVRRCRGTPTAGSPLFALTSRDRYPLPIQIAMRTRCPLSIGLTWRARSSLHSEEIAPSADDAWCAWCTCSIGRLARRRDAGRVVIGHALRVAPPRACAAYRWSVDISGYVDRGLAQTRLHELFTTSWYRSPPASDLSTRTPASACPTSRAWRCTSRSACRSSVCMSASAGSLVAGSMWPGTPCVCPN